MPYSFTGKPSPKMLKPLFEGNTTILGLCDCALQSVLRVSDVGGESLSLSVSLSDMATGSYEMTAHSSSLSLLARFHSAASQRFSVRIFTCAGQPQNR